MAECNPVVSPVRRRVHGVSHWCSGSEAEWISASYSHCQCGAFETRISSALRLVAGVSEIARMRWMWGNANATPFQVSHGYSLSLHPRPRGDRGAKLIRPNVRAAAKGPGSTVKVHGGQALSRARVDRRTR